MKPLLSAKDASPLLAIGLRKLWELTNCGEIPHVRIGRSIRYDPDDLKEWVARQKKRGQTGDTRWRRSARPSTSPELAGDQEAGDSRRHEVG